jgi:predicted ester cyclase
MGQAAAVALRALQAMDFQDWDELRRCCAADDFVMRAGGAEFRSVDEMVPMLEAHYAAFPDSAHRFLNVVEQGATVGLEMQVVATHENTYVTDLGEFPGTGRPISWFSSAFIRVVDGQIRTWTAYLDVMEIHRVVGYVPTPESQQQPA